MQKAQLRRPRTTAATPAPPRPAPARRAPAASRIGVDFARVPVLQRQEKPKAAGPEKKVELTLSPQAIPLDDLRKPEPAAPVAPKSETPEVERSVKLSFLDRRVTTNVEITFPFASKERHFLGQPFLLLKEFKIEGERGPKLGPAGIVQDNVALQLSLKALSWEMKFLKDKIPGLKELGFAATTEAGFDSLASPGRPELRTGLEAGFTYEVPKTPLVFEGTAGYGVKLPSDGPARLEPASKFELSLKYKF